MKKMYSLPICFLALFLFLPTSFAVIDDFCPDRAQAAVDPETETCQEFTNRCEVPDGWRHVPSCSIIEQRNSKPSVEQVLRRRWSGRVGQFNQARPTSDSSYGTRRANYRKVGAGSFTGLKRSGQLTNNTNSRNFSRRSYGRYSKNQKTAGYDESIYDKNTYRRIGGVSNIKRTGALKSAVRFTDERKDHTTEKNYDLNAKHRIWRSVTSLLSEKQSERWKEKLERNANTLQQKRTLRVRPGSATEGDLDGYTERVDD